MIESDYSRLNNLCRKSVSVSSLSALQSTSYDKNIQEINSEMEEIVEYDDADTSGSTTANEQELPEISSLDSNKKVKWEKNKNKFQGLLSIRIKKSRWQNSLHGLNIFHNLVNKGRKMGKKKLFNSTSNITFLATTTCPHESEESFIDNQVDLFTYYSFLTKKIGRMNEEITSRNYHVQSNKNSVEIIFIGCLTSHVTMIFVKLKESIQKNEFNTITYKEIYKLFGESSDKFTKSLEHENISLNALKNAFEGIINEFGKKKNLIFSKREYKKLTKQLIRSQMKRKAHFFKSYRVYNKPSCEICYKTIWEDAIMCIECKALIHKECEQNLKQGCQIYVPKTSTNKFFGVSLETIFPVDNQIPLKLSEMLRQIELKGIHYEGIYRKSGATSKIKEIYDILNLIDNTDLTFLGDVPIHSLATLVKNFFRDLPKPLIGEDVAIDIVNYAKSDPMARSKAFWNILSSFSLSNKIILNVMAHHLAKICENQEENKMTSNSLAIIFTPCLFKQIESDPVTYIHTLEKKTIFVQFLIDFKLFYLKNNQDFPIGESDIPDEYLRILESNDGIKSSVK